MRRFLHPFFAIVAMLLISSAINPLQAADNALHFDGTNDYVGIPVFSSNVNFSQGFTFSAWVKWDAFQGNERVFEIGNGNENTNNSIILRIDNATGKLILQSASGTTGNEIRTTNAVVTTGRWYHVAVTINHVNVGTIYVNGVSVQSGTVYTAQNIMREKNWLGKSAWSSDKYFKGIMDEVSLWNRSLTQTEITKIKNNALTGTEAQLLLYYKFNQGIADGSNAGVTTLNDTKNNYNAKLNNFALTGSTSNWVTGSSEMSYALSINLTTPGSLCTLMSTDDKKDVTHLTLTGTIDARDVKCMRDNMPILKVINMSAVDIAEYIGTEGTYSSSNVTYPADELPDKSFYNKKSLAECKMPNSLTSIGSEVFMYCTGLKGSLTIPSKVTCIDARAFYSCSGLNGVLTIPNSVRTIRQSAFYFCARITKVSVANSTPLFIQFNTFDKATYPLEVPIGSKSAYQADSYWNDLFSIINEADLVYNISVLVGANGTVEADNAQLANNAVVETEKGGTKTFVITPDENYKIATLSYNGTNVKSQMVGNTFTTPAVNASATVNVTFSKIVYNITVQIGANGTVKENNIALANGSTITAQSGTTKTFTITPAANYEVATLTYNGEDVKLQLVDNQYTTPAVNANAPLSVTFAKISYDVTVQVGANGTVTSGGSTLVNNTKLSVEIGATKTFTITPAANYKIATVTYKGVDVKSQLSGNNFTTPPTNANATLSVTFSKNILNVTCATVANGSFSVDKTGASAGETVTITANPAAGYVLKVLDVKNSNNESITVTSENTFIMPAGFDVVVSGEFWRGGFEVTTANPFFEGFESGNMNAWTQQSEVGGDSWIANNPELSNQTSAYAGTYNSTLNKGNTDWLFTPLYLNANTQYDFEMYARQYINVPEWADITVMLGSAANSEAMTNTVVAKTGLMNGLSEKLAGSFTPTETGVYVLGIKGNADSNTRYISIDNIKISLNTVACASVANGTFSVDKLTANPGDTVTISSNPAFGYLLNNYNVRNSNNEVIAVNADNTFVMPEGGQVIVSGAFKLSEEEFNISLAVVENGSFSVDKAKAKQGDIVTITVIPDSGYALKALTVKDSNNEIITVAADCTFTMPFGYDVTVTGQFCIPHEITKVNPFFEGFESANMDLWSQQSEGEHHGGAEAPRRRAKEDTQNLKQSVNPSGMDRNTWYANSNTEIDRIPYAGIYNAMLAWGNTDWLYTPLYLHANALYEFEMYTRQDGANETDANITVMIGQMPNNVAMESIIVAKTGLNDVYQKISGSFTPTASGVYYLGIKGYISYGPYYISIDNIKMSTDAIFTSVSDMQSGNTIKLYAMDCSIVIRNATSEQKAQVYDITGNCIANTLDRSIAVPLPGVYLVRIVGKTHKVLVK